MERGVRGKKTRETQEYWQGALRKNSCFKPLKCAYLKSGGTWKIGGHIYL